jgi:hypothetical protein
MHNITRRLHRATIQTVRVRGRARFGRDEQAFLLYLVIL